MRIMKLDGTRGSCEIILGESLENLRSHCGGKRIIIITDNNVRRLHGSRMEGMEIIEITSGEENKTLETVEKIYKKLLTLEADRGSIIVGVGGGIVCDIAGFVGSTYMRGVEFGFVPTTLLAQVDASIGGKNGVNLENYKNMIGTINQPKFCICDFELLKTLPAVELRCGFAEVIKHAAIGDAELFAYIEANADKALSLHRTTIEKIVHDSVNVKLGIVKNDELEKGERMKLNFGHTLGHAIESIALKQHTNEKISHGEAVAMGMVAAANLSVKKGLLQKRDAERLESLIKQYGLPTKTISMNSLADAVKKDKKRFGKQIKMALLDSIGKCQMKEVAIEELEGVVNDLC
jgi:3-dehydroquinate synthase